MTNKNSEKKDKDKFIINSVSVNIIMNHIIDGKISGQGSVGPFIIHRSDWKIIEKILTDKIKKLCEKNEIEEIKLIN